MCACGLGDPKNFWAAIRAPKYSATDLQHVYFSYFCVREHPLGASFARATHFWERLNDAAGHLPHVDRGRIPTPIFDY